jgi:hypothetical protein
MIAGQLEIQMLANMARLQSDMNDAKRHVSGAMDNIQQSARRAMQFLGGIGAGLSVGVLINKFQQVAVETDKLRGNLVTVTGSADAAGLAFDNLTQFASRTPFTLDQSVNAFIKLKALGLDPSERALASYGNTAAAMGKDMNQMIEAVADASTGEFERLKEFGIKASSQGDQVSFTFQGVTTTIGKNSEEIQEYLLAIGETKFGDAMANQMERLPGQLSNLQDNVDAFFRTIADQGGTSIFAAGIKLLSDGVVGLTGHVDDFVSFLSASRRSVESVFGSISRAGTSSFDAVGDSIGEFVRLGKMSLNSFGFAFADTFNMAGEQGIGVADSLVRAWSIGMVNIVASVQQFGVSLGATIDKFAWFFDRDGTALERAQRLAGINSAAAGASASIQEQANAAFEELDRLRDSLIAVSNAVDAVSQQALILKPELLETTEQFSVLDIKLGDLSGGSLTDFNDGAADSEFIMQGVSTAQAEVVKTTEKVNVVTGSATATIDTMNRSMEVQKNFIENVQREWGNLINKFISGKADVGDFFDTIAKGIGRVFSEAASADATSLFFGGQGGNLMSLLTGGGRGQSSGSGGMGLGNLASLASGGFSFSGIASGVSGFAQGLFGYGQGAAGFMGPMTQSATMGANLGAFMTSPVGIALAAALAGKFIHDATNDPDGFHRGVAGFLAAPTPGAPASSTFAVSPFASGFAPVGFADGPVSIDQARSFIDVYRTLDKTIVDAAIAAGATVAKPGTLAGFGLDGTGAGTLFGGSQRTTEAQFAAQLNSYAKQLVNHIDGLSGETMAALLGANSAEQIVSILTDLNKSNNQSAKATAENARTFTQVGSMIFDSNGALVDSDHNVIASGEVLSRILDAMPYETQQAIRVALQDLQGITEINGMLFNRNGDLINSNGELIASQATLESVMSMLPQQIQQAIMGGLNQAQPAAPSNPTPAWGFDYTNPETMAEINGKSAIASWMNENGLSTDQYDASALGITKAFVEAAKAAQADGILDWDELTSLHTMNPEVSRLLGGDEEIKKMAFEKAYGSASWEDLIAAYNANPEAGKANGLYDLILQRADEITNGPAAPNALYTTMARPDGSHADGLSYVPFDGYLASLHRGEEVLTADDPRNRNNNSMPNELSTQALVKLNSNMNQMLSIFKKINKNGIRIIN